MNPTHHHILARPDAGQDMRFPVGPDARLEFSFDQDAATLGRDEHDLVLLFEDGGSLTLEGIYEHFHPGSVPPVFIIDDGHAVAGRDFLALHADPDLMPTAGPDMLMIDDGHAAAGRGFPVLHDDPDIMPTAGPDLLMSGEPHEEVFLLGAPGIFGNYVIHDDDDLYLYIQTASA